MNIIKRNGTEEVFDPKKILKALNKANEAVDDKTLQLSDLEMQSIALDVKNRVEHSISTVSVEDIQDMVENGIMRYAKFDVARKYITYRYTRSLIRKSNSTDEQILSLLERNNEEVKQENSNKNPIINSVQRDYMAGEVSKDLTKRVLLPSDIMEAHEQGIIHFHDADYFAQHMHNCDLVNMEDMLQNGTVISGTKIEKPHSFG